jgi:DNA-3-methyladenine glycosylase I
MQTAHSRPETLAGYLEAMSRATLTAGISWRVVHSKWDGIKEAFADFDPEKVAAMTPDDVDRLMQNPRVIRNRKKIEAIVDDAVTMLKIDRDSGGFAQYLASRGSFEQRLDAIRHDFAFMGPSTAYMFLALVGDPDADWGRMHEWSQARAGRS